MRTKTLITIILMVVMAISSVAQAPMKFNYQAVARDNSNNVLKDLNLEIKIGILLGAPDGTVIWEEEQSTTTNAIGLFTIEIGDPAATKTDGSVANFSDIDWTAGSYFMEVSMDDGGGYQKMGTAQLLSVPYALFAEQAGEQQTLSLVGQTLSISGGNSIMLPADLVDDADADPNNELQDLSLTTSGTDRTVNISGGTGITMNIADQDNNSTNEIQDLQLSGDDLSITNNGSATTIDLAPYMDNTDNWMSMGANNDSISYMGKIGIGTSSPISKLAVEGSGLDPEEALFTVRRQDGQPVFAVYNEGVRIFVDDSPGIKGSKGGFAVGGFDASKGLTNEYLRITPDSVRVYIDNTNTKGSKGGFAVGGFDASKAETDKFMYLTPEGSNRGVHNTFLGFQSGFSNVDGSKNLFAGFQSGYNNLSGTFNVFMGAGSGFNNKGLVFKGGSHNVFIGNESGFANIESSHNNFIGFRSGYNHTSGNDNVFMGYQAGFSHTTGGGNVFLGGSAGRNNITGTDNVFIGKNAGKNETGTNLLIIESDFIADQPPLIYGEFNNDYLKFNANLDITGAVKTRSSSVEINTLGTGNRYAYIDLVGDDTYSDYGLRMIRYNSGPNAVSRLHHMGTGEFQFYANHAAPIGFFSGGTRRMYLTAGGYLGIGTTSPSSPLEVVTSNIGAFAAEFFNDGNSPSAYGIRIQAGMDVPNVPGLYSYMVYCTDGNGTYEGGLVIDNYTLKLVQNSDRRMKENISGSDVSALSIVRDLEVVDFNFKKSRHRETGFIAQDVEKVFPDMVVYNKEEDSYGISMVSLVPILNKAIQEQQAMIEALTEENKSLKSMEKRLRDLEERIGNK